MTQQKRLAVVSTHPIQYHAPVYAALASMQVDVRVYYGTDCSVVGYRDPGFGTHVVWDNDLLAGYHSEFLGTVESGIKRPEDSVTHDLIERLRRDRPDALLIAGYAPRFYRQAFRVARKLGLPILFRGEVRDRADRRGLRYLPREVLLRNLYKHCAALLYIGQAAKRHYRRMGVNDDRLFFAPYCVDATPFEASEDDRARLRDSTRAALGVSPGDHVLLFSGKLIPSKNPVSIIHAVRHLPPRIRERCVVVYLGDGELATQISAAASESPSVRHKLLGFRNQRELSGFYHAADLLVFPSNVLETWGLVVNDALHHGLPCVTTTDVPSHENLIVPGRTGYSVSSAEREVLASGIEQGLALADRADVRAECRGQVSAYSVHNAATGIAAALAAVVN